MTGSQRCCPRRPLPRVSQNGHAGGSPGDGRSGAGRPALAAPEPSCIARDLDIRPRAVAEPEFDTLSRDGRAGLATASARVFETSEA